MIDIRKAMRLLDTMYVSANESIKNSVDKIVTLAQLDPSAFGSNPGPFEQLLNDFENIKWQFGGIKTSTDKFEKFINAPYNEFQFTNWLNSYVTSLPMLVTMTNRITNLEIELANIKEKNESELNRNTK
jgi:hypothetical protein